MAGMPLTYFPPALIRRMKIISFFPAPFITVTPSSSSPSLVFVLIRFQKWVLGARNSTHVKLLLSPSMTVSCAEAVLILRRDYLVRGQCLNFPRRHVEDCVALDCGHPHMFIMLCDPSDEILSPMNCLKYDVCQSRHFG